MQNNIIQCRSRTNWITIAFNLGIKQKATLFDVFAIPFNGEKLKDSILSEPEQAVKQQFETTLARLAKTRLLSVSNEIRIKMRKARKNKK